MASVTYRLVNPPANTPLNVEEVKDHLRVSGTTEDTYLAALLQAATESVAEILRRPLTPTVFDAYLDAFPNGAIYLLPSLQSVESVTYTDTDGVVATFETFVADTIDSSLYPAVGSRWPATDGTSKVRIRFTAGYPEGECPFSIRAAILLLVADLYENREGQGVVKLHENRTVDRLLWPHRVWN